MIRVLLIDDHQIFRDGIISLFNEVKDIHVSGVASNAAEAVSKAKSVKPNVILLDISLPDRPGLEVLEELIRHDPALKIIILSMHTREEYISRAIKSGAKAYLAKEDTTKTELLAAMRDVMEGKEYYSKSISRQMTDSFVKAARNQSLIGEVVNYNTLSKREKEVLGLVVEGLSNHEIAEKLFVNIRTVETHKTNILQKLGLKNSVDLVRFALKNRLLEL